MVNVYDAEACPKCGTSWIGAVIPEADRPHFGNQTHFKRGPIGVEYGIGPERYDGISEYTCPDCKTRWGRWTGKEIASGYLESRFGERSVVRVKDGIEFNDWIS